jgi:hypothetical protein
MNPKKRKITALKFILRLKIKGKVDVNWTDEIPETEGYYWVDCFAFGQRVVPVFTRPGHDYLCINNPDVCRHTKSDFWAVKSLGAKWAGPIKKPNLI